MDKLVSVASPTQVSHLPEPPGKPLAEPSAEVADDETRAQNDNKQNREADRAEAAPECDLASEHPAEPPLELSAKPLAEFANETFRKLPAEPLIELSTESPSADKVGGMQSRDKQQNWTVQRLHLHTSLLLNSCLSLLLNHRLRFHMR